MLTDIPADPAGAAGYASGLVLAAFSVIALTVFGLYWLMLAVSRMGERYEVARTRRAKLRAARFVAEREAVAEERPVRRIGPLNG